MTAEELRKDILEKTVEYYRLVHAAKAAEPFVPGKSRVNYAGRVFDEKEMQNLKTAIREILHLAIESFVTGDAETAYPHTFRRGQCVLCGYEKKETLGKELPVERIFLLPVNEETPNQFFCSLTGQDLEDAAADILVLQPEDCEAAIALQTEPLWEEMNRTGSTLTAEIESPGAGEVNAFVRLYTAEGLETFPTAEQLSLRIYNDEEGETLPVTYTDPEGEETEAEAARVTPEEADPYWSVTWLGEGTYTY